MLKRDVAGGLVHEAVQDRVVAGVPAAQAVPGAPQDRLPHQALGARVVRAAQAAVLGVPVAHLHQVGTGITPILRGALMAPAPVGQVVLTAHMDPAAA